jgi:hypothetical protein
MSKYNQLDNWDSGTNAPSENFIYEFGLYRYWVHEDWKEVLSHDADGSVLNGSLDMLIEAFQSGCEVKVGIRGICADLSADPERAMDHEGASEKERALSDPMVCEIGANRCKQKAVKTGRVLDGFFCPGSDQLSPVMEHLLRIKRIWFSIRFSRSSSSLDPFVCARSCSASCSSSCRSLPALAQL